MGGTPQVFLEWIILALKGSYWESWSFSTRHFFCTGTGLGLSFWINYFNQCWYHSCESRTIIPTLYLWKLQFRERKQISQNFTAQNSGTGFQRTLCGSEPWFYISQLVLHPQIGSAGQTSRFREINMIFASKLRSLDGSADVVLW